LPSEGKGHTFESCRVRHKINDLTHEACGAVGYGYHMATKITSSAGHESRI
jgi:hypothetical protein